MTRRRKLLVALAIVAGVLMLVGSVAGPSPAARASYCSPIWHPLRYCRPGVFGRNFDRWPPWVHRS